jgi:hypothetical protein
MPDQYSYLIGKRYGEENLGVGRPETDVKSQTNETGGHKSGNNCLFDSQPNNENGDISPPAPTTNKTEIIADFSGSAQVSETAKFRDFEQDNSSLRIYDIYRYHVHLYHFIFNY